MASLSPVPVYLFTFNCGRELVNPQTITDHFFSALNPTSPLPEIIAIGLQEFAPVSYSFIGSSFLTPYFQSWSSVLPIISQSPTSKFPEYVEIGRKNLGMTALFLYSSRPERIKEVLYAGVGFGVLNMGNKGAVAARIRYSKGDDDDEDMEITIVSTHLEAHEHMLHRRNQNWEALVRRTVFESNPSTHSDGQDETAPLLQEPDSPKDTPSMSGIYTPTTHLLIMGDLNYRTSDTSPLPEHFARFPRSPNDLPELLKNDQLTRELRSGNTLHGLTEAEITFGPTYKFKEQKYRDTNGLPKGNVSIDTEAEAWNWAPHRWPSWCDRILYLPQPSAESGGAIVHRYTSIPQITVSDHRPVGLHISLPAFKPNPENRDSNDIRYNPPFPLDKDWRSERQSAESREWIAGYLILMVTTAGGIALVACGVAGVGMLTWALTGR